MKSKSIRISSATITSLLLLAGGLAALNAQAQSNDQWTGGGVGNLFSAPLDWSAAATPASGDSLEFGGVGPVTTLINDLSGYGFTSITYDGGALGFTITGNAFTNGTATASTIITVNSANAQTINNNMTLGNANQTINLAGGNLTLGGVISGAGTGSGLSLTGGYTLTLNGANTYGSAGATTNSAGIIKTGNASALGASRLYIASGATNDLNGNNLSVAFINNVGALTGGTIDNVSAGGTVTLKVGSGQGGVNAASGTYTAIDSFSGNIRNTTGTVGLTKVAPSVANQTAGIMATASLLNGPAVLRLMNTNTYTGPTTINGGIVDLNFGNTINGVIIYTNIVSPGSALVLAGGDLTLEEQTTPCLQTFAGLTLNAGASHIGAYRNGSSSMILNLIGITRNTGSTVDFQSRPSSSSSNGKIGAADGTDTTTNINANFTGGQTTILGGYATYNGNVPGTAPTWAVSGNTANTAKTLTALAAYTTNTSFTAGKDMDVTSGSSTPAAMTVNSLRFTQVGAATVSSSGNLVVATGGIMEAPQVGANAVAFNNNNLTSGNGQDLIINQLNTGGTMTIGANIVDNSGSIGLTKSGQGALTLTPNVANTFSGQLTINAGTVTLGNANALNGVPALVFGGTSQTFGSASYSFLFANGILNLNGNSASVASLTASADSSGTPILQNGSATPATLAINGSAATAFTGTLQDGTGGGPLSLLKSGSGTQTLGGTLSYSGSTTVGAGTLALTTAPTATTSYAVNGILDVTALTSGTLALTSPQILSGSGTVSGNVTVASGAHTLPGVTGVTNTITGNLTYVTGAKADFDLNTSATNAPNDRIVLSGAGSVLTCGSIQINLNLMGATLDTNNDYVLFQLTGGSASISGTFLSTPNWLTTVPANSGSYSIVTDTVNKNVRLHFTQAAAATLTASANPATVVRNESTFISVTATPGSGTITNVYLDLSSIGGSLSVPLTLSGMANVYTNTVAIPAAASVGGATVQAHATDTTPLTGTASIALTILATNEVWNGASTSDANWSDNKNWVSVTAPGLVGDSVTFDASSQLTPNLDNSYSLTSLTFDSAASAYVIGTANSSVLTLTGALTNNSANAQTLNVPVVLVGVPSINAAADDITIGGAISGGGLTKMGNYTLYLGSGANSYTGVTVVSNGTVSISQNASIGTSQITLAGGTLASGYNAATRLTLGNNIYVPAGNTGTIVMSALNRLNGTVTGSGILNINAPGGQDDIGGGWSTYAGQVNIFGGGTFRFVINGGGFNGFNQASVTMTNVSVSVSDNSTGNSFNVGALTVDETATITGPYQGNSPNFIIGGLNQNDVIAGAVQNSTRITKIGTGNLTITSAGTATYTGQTIVSNGTLTVLGSISSSPVTNYSGSTLAGTGTFGAVVDLEAGSSITPVVGGYGIMTCSSDLTFNGGTNVVYISTTNSDLITVGGNLNLLGGAVRLVVGNTLTNGVYKLIGYSGSESGAAANLSLSGFTQSGQVALLTDTTANEIDLIVTTPASANLIWASAGAANNLWDVNSSVNWSNGASLTYFSPGDHVTFNDSGAGNTTVDLRAAVQPSTMVVTGTQAYVFESSIGTGRLSGPTNSLTVLGTGSLEIDVVNDYGGPTTIGSGATLTAGNGSESASLGAGIITDNGTLIFNQTNNLSLTNIVGAGTLAANGASTLTLAGTYGYSGATTIGSGATLQAGIGNSTGPLLGPITDNGTLIMNQSGSVTLGSPITGSGNVIQSGSSVLTMNVANTYQGNTYINNGVLKMGANSVTPNALVVSGSTGWLILDGNATNAGTFDLNGFNESVNALQGLGGTVLGDITNSSTANVTNTLTFGNNFGSPSTTYAGLISENANISGGKIALVEIGISTNGLTGANSYSGGTIVAGGTLNLGNNTAAGSGSISLSNGVTLGIAGGSIYIGNNIYVGAGATVTNTSTSLGSYFNSLYFSGDGNSTNVITSGVSLEQVAIKQFQGFTGTVLISAGAQMRFAATTLGTNGGDNTTFEIEGTLNTRNGTVAGPGISLGALTGAGYLSGAGNAAGNTAYTIGAKGISSTFSGMVQDGGYGNTSIIKVGAGTLTLSGVVTNTGSTTVSNGVLALVDPVVLDYSPTINLGSSTATIDVSGLAIDTLNLGNLNAQTLNGIGTINGSLDNKANSTIKVGLGILNVTGTATLNGTNILQLNRTNAPNCSEIIAGAYSIGGPLTVTNVGPALQGGDTFQLFNHAVTGFTVTNLPALTGSMYWTNKLAVNGSIAVVNPVNTSPPPIIASFNGTILSLSWPTNAGWTLQAQTNSLATGLKSGAGNWVTFVPGSTGITATNITVDATKPTVFYRLVYP